MAETITIAGHSFTVPLRYEEGHELTANEASALNQTYHENLRNNFAKKVETAKNGGDLVADATVLADLQAELDKYAEEYEFGGARGGGFRGDPVMTEAMRIAREKIYEHLKKKGKKRKDVESGTITEAAKKLIEKTPAILALAKQRVEETRAAASSELDDVVAQMG